MRQDVYGVALTEASAELGAITTRFEQLRARKEHLEGVVRAIGTMLGVDTPIKTVAGTPRVNVPPPAPSPVPAQPQSTDPVAYTFNQVPNPLPDLTETGGDPFQRRVRNALKMRGLGNSQEDLQPAV